MNNIGILGAGIMGNRLKKRFLKEDGVNISWICDIDIQKVQKLAELTNAKTTVKLKSIYFSCNCPKTLQ